MLNTCAKDLLENASDINEKKWCHQNKLQQTTELLS